MEQQKPMHTNQNRQWIDWHESGCLFKKCKNYGDYRKALKWLTRHGYHTVTPRKRNEKNVLFHKNLSRDERNKRARLYYKLLKRFDKQDQEIGAIDKFIKVK